MMIFENYIKSLLFSYRKEAPMLNFQGYEIKAIMTFQEWKTS